MDLQLLLDNLFRSALLFFFLGLFAVQIKSDLEIPESSSKFISFYLLFAIGFKGGQELSHSVFDLEILWSMLLGTGLAIVVPIYTYFILRRKMNVQNSGAIAAAYGSISAVTFVTAVSFLEMQQIPFGGHMIAIMALMEAPSIIVGVMLMTLFSDKKQSASTSKGAVKHAVTNGSVVLILGSLVIGFLASDSQAEGIEPFTTDIFKGFLAVFLLDMGITSGKKLGDFLKSGRFTTAFAIIAPIINGCLVAWISGSFIASEGDRFMLAVLAASASYIAVPAAMKIAAPKANPGIFLPMALAVTFPVNITLGMPIYLWVVSL